MIDVNRAMLEAVVAELGDLRDDVVFIGGAVAGLLITSPGGDPIRETDDVDCIVELGSSVLNYGQIERRLQALGWAPGSMTVEGDPLCRFRKGALTVDVMPTNDKILGFAARWASEAIAYATSQSVGKRNVQVISAPYFLAMKIEAFKSRGKDDYYGSHDLEDLVMVVEGRSEIIDEVAGATTPQLRAFLGTEIETMWARLVAETVPGAMRGVQVRCELVETRLDAIRRL